MSNAANKLLLAAAGNAGEAVYVDDVFSTYLYDGTGSSLEINNGMDLSGEGGLVWIKGRTAVNATQDHRLVDTERGVNEAISSAANDNVLNITGEFTSFDNDGFTLASTSGNGLNRSGEEYCSWTFRNQPGFFEVVKYEGNGTAGRTVSHNLGSAPGCIIVKRVESGQSNGDFFVYHRGNTASPETDYLLLNSSNATADSTSAWNDTAPTATNFTLGSSSDVNASSNTYIAYLFAHDDQSFGTDSDESIIKCGSYSGNSGSQTIDVGFEAQWVLIKNTTSGSTDWFVVDVMRRMVDTTAVDTALIRANETDAEQLSGAGGARITTRSNGFGFLSESNLSCNRTGETYIYVAIRRPHKPASEFAATDLFDPIVGQTSGKPNYSSSTGVVDAVLRWTKTSDSGYPTLASRLTDPKYVLTSGYDTEANYPDNTTKLHFAMNDGWGDNIGGTSTNVVVYMWRRTPEFFDVVTYTGTGSARTVGHNLGVVPEMMWVKNRSSAYSWSVYHSATGATKYLTLNTNVAPTTNAEAWNDTAPTNSVFTVKDDGRVNLSGDNHIAYLFASVSGISKVGSYTGTGSDVNVDCGFSAGARLVLIKRSDSTGDWYVWDAENGIVAGDDPYKLLNSGNAQVTNTDYIDPLSSGFTITSSAPAGLNASGGTYIF